MHFVPKFAPSGDHRPTKKFWIIRMSQNDQNFLFFRPILEVFSVHLRFFLWAVLALPCCTAGFSFFHEGFILFSRFDVLFTISAPA